MVQEDKKIVEIKNADNEFELVVRLLGNEDNLKSKCCQCVIL